MTTVFIIAGVIAYLAIGFACAVVERALVPRYIVAPLALWYFCWPVGLLIYLGEWLSESSLIDRCAAGLRKWLGKDAR